MQKSCSMNSRTFILGMIWAPYIAASWFLNRSLLGSVRELHAPSCTSSTWDFKKKTINAPGDCRHSAPVSKHWHLYPIQSEWLT